LVPYLALVRHAIVVRVDPERNRSAFECSPYVCPEPGLVKGSFIHRNGAKSFRSPRAVVVAGVDVARAAAAVLHGLVEEALRRHLERAREVLERGLAQLRRAVLQLVVGGRAGRGDLAVACENRPSFSELFLSSLSRACLGKMMIYSNNTKWYRKRDAFCSAVP
jgi:hypothetical protein